MDWERMAYWCKETYGSFVDWDERFFICPECGEPIYECDYSVFDKCPICEEPLYNPFDEE